MDFLLALTHFCEVHGPTSILSSQIVPSACPTCDAAPSPTPPPPRPSARSSPSSPGSSPRSSSTSSSSSSPPRRIEDDPRFVRHRADDHVARVTATQTPPRASASSSSAPSSTTSTASSTPNPSASSALSSTSPAVAPDACASCSLTLPEELRNQLPPGGHGASGPVLRSTELVHSCGEPDGEHHQQQPPHITSTALSDVAEPPCHPHILTYLSQRGPPNAESYALLRNASIRTLMCELLPRGLSAGPLSFGDPAAGYTIAYIFRLPDPMARGKRRSYALIALAGRDGQRAFRASPVIWRVFSHVASGIIAAAERVQRDEAEAAGGAAVTSSTLRSRAAAPAAAAATAAATAAAYAPGRGRASFSSSSLSPPHAYASPPTPTNHVSASASSTTSSFLLGRPPNAYSAYQAHAHYGYSHPRRAGQIRARNLAEIVANQYVFTELHGQFVVLLFTLAGMFPQGGSAGVGAGVGGANVGSLCGGNSSADSGNSGGGGDAGAGGTGGSGPRGSTSCGTRVRTTTVHLEAETEATHKDEKQRDAERSQLPVPQSSASSSTSSTTTLSSAPTPNHNHDHRPSTAACTAKPNHDRLHGSTDDNDAADADNDDDDTTASNNNNNNHNGHGAASGRAGARSLMQHAPPPMRAPLAV